MIDKNTHPAGIMGLYLNEIKAWRANQKQASIWQQRNEQNIRVLLNTLEVEYLVFQQDVFLLRDDSLAEKFLRIGFKLVPVTSLKAFKDPWVSFCHGIYWHEEHNNVIRMASPKMMENLTTALQIINSLGTTEDRFTKADIMQATLKTLSVKN